jgi:Na+-translocating ferredoxin:NAD+ oxidoreductase RnfD subunit
MNILIETLGWIGSIAILAAYGLNSFQKIKSDSAFFQILNLLGGVFLIINSIYHEAYPFTFINSIWVLIALPALVKILSRKS